ncbi:hypothetical protein OS493_009437 [Desmophyllum pertusum]|uniref:Uncharacterized protein n=1 Tax=Desmophyllum pertusum TaxID=174260 RepID=A0A9W9Z317_9CNID|nr:hypothetical protein OS493_009437 [Desmophyllum pertusum]
MQWPCLYYSGKRDRMLSSGRPNKGIYTNAGRAGRIGSLEKALAFNMNKTLELQEKIEKLSKKVETMQQLQEAYMIANEPVEQTPGMVEESNYNEPVAPQEKQPSQPIPAHHYTLGSDYLNRI